MLAICAAPTVFAAPPKSPEAFLQDIYAHYRGSADTSKGIAFDKDADYRRYFADDLARLMIVDANAAAKAGGVPALDGDPFIDAQDWDISHLTVHIDTESASTARATVSFVNLKERTTIHLQLVATPKGWRITDIVWPGTDGTLRGLYKKK
jgi:hypothetical protein